MSRLFLFSEHRYPRTKLTVFHEINLPGYPGFASSNEYVIEQIEVISGTAPTSITSQLPHVKSMSRKDAEHATPAWSYRGTLQSLNTVSDTVQERTYHELFGSTWTQRHTRSKLFSQQLVYDEWRELYDDVDLSNTTTFPRDAFDRDMDYRWVAGTKTLVTTSRQESPPRHGINNVFAFDSGYQQATRHIFVVLVAARAPGIYRHRQWYWPEGDGFNAWPWSNRDYSAATLVGCTDQDQRAAGWIISPLDVARESDISAAGNVVVKSTDLELWRLCP